MIWLTWRQSRGQLIAAAAVLVASALALWLTGPGLAHLYNTSGVAACNPNLTCATLATRFLNKLPKTDLLLCFTGIGLICAVPAVIGMFCGAPLVAREIETHTHRLVWNQSITRTCWLAAKLTIIALTAMVLTCLLELVLSWWSSPIDSAAALNPTHGISLIRTGPALFDVRGVAPVAYTGFAFILGVTAGTLLHRTLPAMATTIAGFALIQVAMPSLIRPHLVAPAHANVALNTADILGLRGQSLITTPSYTPTGGWILSTQVIGKSGHEFHTALTSACQTGNFQACLASLTRLRLRQLITYQPASHSWAMQWLETTIFLTLALLLAGVCFWWIHRPRVA